MKTRMILFIMLLMGGNSLWATTYYISGNGSDGNNGLSISTPWKSIAKLNTANLQPGDSALFECGHIYRGQINAKAGTAGSPVYYGAYGSGAKPVISGANQIQNSAWNLHQGNIYWRFVSMPSMSAAEPPNLFWNGQLMIPARYPNSGYLTANTVYGQNPGSNCCEYSYSLQHPSLSFPFPNAADLEGAHITGYTPYGVSSRLINSYVPGQGVLHFDTLRGINFIRSKRYFLSRKLNLLDTPGEWFYDAPTQKLYAWFPNGAAPSATDTVEYSNTNFGIYDWEIPYITVEGLEFRHQQIAGMYIIRSTGVKVMNNTFRNSKYGIHGWGNNTTALSGTVIKNNLFENIHRVAINLKNYIDNALVSENVIRNIGINNALMQSGNPDQWSAYGYYEYGTGIELHGTNSVISLNRIDSTGKPSIAAGGSGTLIKNNIINCPCINYNDCGGIMPLGNSTVDGNIIKNSLGYFTTSNLSYGARGIYPDFRTGDVIINNTIVNTVTGIGLTNSKNTQIKNNTIYNSSRSQFMMNRKNAGQLNNTIKGNIFFGLTHEQNSLLWDNQFTGIDNNSVLDSNYYWNPYSYYPLVKYLPDGDPLSEAWYDLTQWQTTGKDLNSKKEFVFKNSPYVITDTTGSNLIQNGDFNSGITGWNNTGNIVFTTTTGQLDGSCADITYNGIYFLTATISQNIAQSFVPGNYYLISFSLKGTSSSDGEPLVVKLVETNNPSAQHFYRAFKINQTRQDLWTVWKADTNIPLTIQINALNGKYYLDNVQILPVDVTWTDPESVFPIFINETSSPLTVNLPTGCNYLDLDSIPVGTSITLQPFSSQILILDACSTITNVNEPVFLTKNIKVYPNPSNDLITIEYLLSEYDKQGSVSIYNTQGQLLLQQALSKEKSIVDISRLTSGVYLLMLKDGANTVTSKIVKQ